MSSGGGHNLGFRIEDGMLIQTKPELIQDTELAEYRMRPATDEEIAMWPLVAVTEAAEAFAGINLCACGHHHSSDADGADGGCMECECDTWTEHPLDIALAAFRAAKEEQG